MAAMFSRGIRPSLGTKLALAVGLAVMADLLFWKTAPGISLGVFALAFTGALGIAQPALWRDRRAVLAWSGTVVAALAMAVRPTFAGWLVFGVMLGIASLSARSGPRDDAFVWLQRLIIQPIAGLAGPVIDAIKLSNPRLKAAPFPLVRLFAVLAVPVIGGLVFLGLFAAANPVIRDALDGVDVGDPDLARLIFWLAVTGVAWHVLRPRHLRSPVRLPERGGKPFPGISTASVLVSLVTFNAIFAVQNGLDIAFLWSGQRLPEQFTLAEYVHHGVFPLMLTALLAALFVLAALRPGSDMASNRVIRWLVVLWTAQNCFLVASAAARMGLYVESYSLTRLRLLILLWMALVAFGLVAILWRVLREKSPSWLVNVNAAALIAATFLVAVVDTGAIAAHWNVGNAKEMGGRGVELDVCYLRKLGDAAILPLAEVEARSRGELRQRAAWARRRAHEDLIRRQSDPRSWTPLGAWRLARVAHLSTAIPTLGAGGDCRSPAAIAADRLSGFDTDPGPATVPAAPPAPTPAPQAAPPDIPPEAPAPATPELTSEPQSR